MNYNAVSCVPIDKCRVVSCRVVLELMMSTLVSDDECGLLFVGDACTVS